MRDGRESIAVKAMAKLRIRFTSRMEWDRFKIN